MKGTNKSFGETVEEMMQNLAVHSEQINDSLWYVNPNIIRAALHRELIDNTLRTVKTERERITKLIEDAPQVSTNEFQQVKTINPRDLIETLDTDNV